MQAIKDNYVWEGSVKYRLSFTKAENKNQYLTDLTNRLNLG